MSRGGRTSAAAAFAAVLLALVAARALGEPTPYASGKPDGEPFNKALAGMSVEATKKFRAGSSIFRQAWVTGPSQDHPDFEGLGPLYNRLSCIACHVKNGRGLAPEDGEVARAMVVRLSVPGADPHGAPQPHPVYGAQLNPEGILGVPGEGRARVAYEFFDVRLDDGETVAMRRPRLVIDDLAYGPLGANTKISPRNAPPTFGLGLLEAVPSDTILAFARESGGRPNYVYDIESGAAVLGRFGLKANQPSLKQQIANAFAEDIGISSGLFPGENCAAAEAACVAAAKEAKGAELSAQQLDETLAYIRGLAPPAPRGGEKAAQGEALFATLGCAACHRPAMKIGRFDSVPALSGAEIHPYADLLLHDMGDGLADGREDFGAGPRDWRTPPLWGLGLAGQFGDGRNYLHDGRARTIAEAILWHGGDATDAARGFRALKRDERQALLAFLNQL
jgi:CxxC motif-containing protein (DUF1111 family)